MKTMIQAQNATIMFVTDPSHGWLAVATDTEELDGLPEAASFASQFSYVGPQMVFLEEDEDAVKFIKHYGIDTAQLPTHHYEDTDHFIRSLPRGNN